MAHPRQCAGLGGETLNEVVTVQARMDELDRDAPIERFVLGEEDDPHRAAPERPKHPVHAVDEGTRFDGQETLGGELGGVCREGLEERGVRHRDAAKHELGRSSYDGVRRADREIQAAFGPA
jgi:hypothetical protein